MCAPFHTRGGGGGGVHELGYKAIPLLLLNTSLKFSMFFSVEGRGTHTQTILSTYNFLEVARVYCHVSLLCTYFEIFLGLPPV